MLPQPFLERCLRWLDETLATAEDPLHPVACVRKLGPAAVSQGRVSEQPQAQQGVPVAAQPRAAHDARKVEAAREPALVDGAALSTLRQKVASCQACGLAARRKRSVSFGNPGAPLMLISDYPAFCDELQGRYFYGEDGALLDRMLAALGLTRNLVWLTGALKCHTTVVPGSDLTPLAPCKVHLAAELALAKPALAIGFGPLVYRYLFEKDDYTAIRGRELRWNGVPIRFTHHPRELLDDPALKRETWEDLKPLKGCFSTTSPK